MSEETLEACLEFCVLVMAFAGRDVDTLRASDTLYHLGELARELHDKLGGNNV